MDGWMDIIIAVTREVRRTAVKQPINTAKVRLWHFVSGKADVGTSFEGCLSQSTLKKQQDVHFEEHTPKIGTQPRKYVEGQTFPFGYWVG